MNITAAVGGLKRVPNVFSLKGVFPAFTTPFNDKQEIFYEKLKENLQSYEKLPFSGYLVNGSNGEVGSCTLEERIQILQTVRQVVDPQRILIANAYCETTKQCCELTKALASHGADAVLLMVPFYHRRQLNEEGILAHFQIVADSSPVPVVVYNNRGVTNTDISVETLLKLAEHPNIRGVKDDDVRKIAEIVLGVKRRGLDCEVLQSGAGYILQSLVIGASGAMVSLPNIVGREVCQLCQLYRESKLEEAAELQRRLVRIDSILSLSHLGVPGMKGALDLVGLYGGPCRLPLQPLKPQDLKLIRDVMVEDGLL